MPSKRLQFRQTVKRHDESSTGTQATSSAIKILSQEKDISEQGRKEIKAAE